MMIVFPTIKKLNKILKLHKQSRNRLEKQRPFIRRDVAIIKEFFGLCEPSMKGHWLSSDLVA